MSRRTSSEGKTPSRRGPPPPPLRRSPRKPGSCCCRGASPPCEELQKLDVTMPKRPSTTRGKRSAEMEPPPSTDDKRFKGAHKESLLAELRVRMDGLVDDEVIERAVGIAQTYTMLFGADADSIQKTLSKMYCGWTSADLVNISYALSHCKRTAHDNILTAPNKEQWMAQGIAERLSRRSQDNSAVTYQDKGLALKRSLNDDNLVLPLEEERAEAMWPKVLWDQIVSMAKNRAVTEKQKVNLDKLMEELLGVSSFDQCSFELVVTGSKTTEAVRPLKPDMMLKMKGFDTTPYTVGALFALKSTTSGSYDSDADLGQLATYGEVLLRRAGPVRDSIMLLISDLKMIRGFQLTRGEEWGSPRISPLNPCVAIQSKPTSSVRSTLCALVANEPSALGIHSSFPIYCLPQGSWQVNKFLGAGATSQVYAIEMGNRLCALKVPCQDTQLEDDVTYLTLLEGTEGVPRIVERIGSSIIMEPVVGRCVNTITDIDIDASLGDLVDVLLVAHGKGIVNRDVRIENIMIAKSLCKEPQDRLFLLDWGYAAKRDATVKFRGSLVTASEYVLKHSRSGYVAYRNVDDLVALVHCTYLLCYPEVVDEAYKLSTEGCICFWRDKLKEPIWTMAQNAATAGDYHALKNLLTDIHISKLRTVAWKL